MAIDAVTAPTITEALVAALAARGVKRIFGIPGGGSSLDLIEAASARGLDFVLARTENAATLMAAATAELTGTPGVVLTTLGPGAMSAVNGVAFASLDRTPLVLVSDALDEGESHVTHPAVDQAAVLAPITKGYRSLAGGDGPAEIDALLDTGLAHPQGPVHIDLNSTQARAPAGAQAAARADPDAALDDEDVAAARRLLAAAERPVILAGLQAREAPGALAGLARSLACPVFTTYKAKGTMPDSDPLQVGHFTGGKAEAPCVREADLILLFGFDPVELIPHPWRYEAPIIELGRAPGLPHYRAPEVALIGPLDTSAEALAGANRPSRWAEGEIAGHRERMRAGLMADAGAGIDPRRLVLATAAAAPPRTRITVDAGAHMFSAMGMWRAQEANGALISNGLSTMSYGLPAAIASALEEPARQTVCFTGDGGLLMCVAELMTAAERGLPVLVVVSNDAALSLIDIKQQARGLPERGMRYPAADLAAVARGLGCRAWRVTQDAELEPALAEAFAAPGPALLDVTVDPAAYPSQLAALRG